MPFYISGGSQAAAYRINGSGRDTYIYHDNGGLTSSFARGPIPHHHLTSTQFLTTGHGAPRMSRRTHIKANPWATTSRTDYSWPHVVKKKRLPKKLKPLFLEKAPEAEDVEETIEYFATNVPTAVVLERSAPLRATLAERALSRTSLPTSNSFTFAPSAHTFSASAPLARSAPLPNTYVVQEY